MKATPQTIIQMTYDRAKTKEEAVDQLAFAAQSNIPLRDYLVVKGAQAAIGERVRTDNARIYQGNPDADVTSPRRIVMSEPPLVSGAHKARIRATASVLRLLAAVLPNGTKMADAKRADLDHAIGVFAPQAEDMLHKAAYFRGVRAKLPAGKSVEEVFDNASLTAIYRTSAAYADDVVGSKKSAGNENKAQAKRKAA